MINMVSNADSFLAALDKQELALKTELNIRYTRWTKSIANRLIEITPQWSSNTVQNWTYKAGSLDSSYTETPEKSIHSAIYMVGSDPGVAKAKAKIAAQAGPVWGQPVFIGNFTPVTDLQGEYAVDGFEDKSVRLRGVNMAPAQGALISYVLDFGGGLTP